MEIWKNPNFQGSLAAAFGFTLIPIHRLKNIRNKMYSLEYDKIQK